MLDCGSSNHERPSCTWWPQDVKELGSTQGTVLEDSPWWVGMGRSRKEVLLGLTFQVYKLDQQTVGHMIT